MKRILTIVLAAVAFLAAENTADAQLLKNLLNKVTGNTTQTTTTTETATEATVNGKAAGTALRALYTQYKADKKLDMSNLNNIANVATFSANVQGLKGQPNKGTFYKDFVSGLISGSNNLVNETNSITVMDTITGLVENVDLSGVEQKATEVAETAASAASSASSAVSNVASVAESVSSILSLFK
jgi:hypothetical protein